jgi:hypothetical protein
MHKGPDKPRAELAIDLDIKNNFSNSNFFLRLLYFYVLRLLY